jgi:hypothetical protein
MAEDHLTIITEIISYPRKTGEKLVVDFILSIIAYIFAFYSIVEAYRSWPEVQYFIAVIGLILFVTFFILYNIYFEVFKTPIVVGLKKKHANEKYIIITIITIYVILIRLYFYVRGEAIDKFASMSDPFWHMFEVSLFKYIFFNVILLIIGSLVYRKFKL